MSLLWPLIRTKSNAVGLLDPTTGSTYILNTKSADPLLDLTPDRAPVWRTLDVAIFHHLMVDQLLRPGFGGDAIEYKFPHQLADLRSLSEAEPGRLGAVLQATSLASVHGVSLAGEVMPPKSTFFYPKLATGLAINPLS